MSAKEPRSSDLSANQTSKKNAVLPSKQKSDTNSKMLNPNSLTAGSLHNSNSSNVSGNSSQSELGRKKMVLGKGYSLMDWIRVSKGTPNIAGNHGILRPISYEELAKHNTEDDCWMAIYDKVYNCTPYMKFHPGGVDELMKGAGKNATDIFNDVHPWVNFQSMLEKCLIGNLVGKPQKAEDSKQTDVTTGSTSTPESLTELIPKELRTCSTPAEMLVPAVPTYDSYHTIDTINVVMYTKWPGMRSDFVIIDQVQDQTVFNNKSLVVFLYIREDVFKFTADMSVPIKDNYKVKVSKEGKVEITFLKLETFSNMAKKITFNVEPVTIISKSGTNFRTVELVDKIKVTHNTYVYIFQLPESTRMCVPLGYHVFLKFYQVPDDYPIKPYTVISKSMLADSCSEEAMREENKICLMIKQYQDGYFTSKLTNYKIGDKFLMSNFIGSFKRELLLDVGDLVLLCAGSGFTPMIRVMIEAIQLDSIKSITLLFFNRMRRDILWSNELKEFQSKYAERVTVVNILSLPDNEWPGERGSINAELLEKQVFEKELKQPLFLICGPKPFTNLASELIHEKGYDEKAIHAFLG